MFNYSFFFNNKNNIKGRFVDNENPELLTTKDRHNKLHILGPVKD